jgi:hypothetical protein
MMPRIIRDFTKNPPGGGAAGTTATVTTTQSTTPLPPLIVALRNVFHLLDDETFLSEIEIERQRRVATHARNAAAGEAPRQNNNNSNNNNNATTGSASTSSSSISAREKISTATGLLVLSQSQLARKRPPPSVAAAAASGEQNVNVVDSKSQKKTKQTSSPRRSLPTTITQRDGGATTTTSTASAAGMPITIVRLQDPEQMKKLEALKKLHPHRKCVALEGPPYPPASPFFQGGDVTNASSVFNFPVKLNYDTLIPEGMSCCVMCGEARPDWSSKSEKTRKKKNGDDDALANKNSAANNKIIIPAQNKGVCTACDVKVWIVVATGLEIKWCKGCKNFRPWRAAFGTDKPQATKCTRCRERSKLSYEMKKSEGFVVHKMQQAAPNQYEADDDDHDDDDEQQQQQQQQGQGRGSAAVNNKSSARKKKAAIAGEISL